MSSQKCNRTMVFISYTEKLEEQKNMLKIWYTLLRWIHFKSYHPIAICLRENPRTVTRIQTNEENRFEYFFMALSPCITRFTSCRLAIAINGIHFKGKYTGVLFAAIDGNEQIFPIAFGVGDLENDWG